MVRWWMTISSLFVFFGAILFYSQSVIHEPWEDLATFGYKLNMKVKYK
jgi:hypothetical protein